MRQFTQRPAGGELGGAVGAPRPRAPSSLIQSRLIQRDTSSETRISKLWRIRRVRSRRRSFAIPCTSDGPTSVIGSDCSRASLTFSIGAGSRTMESMFRSSRDGSPTSSASSTVSRCAMAPSRWRLRFALRVSGRGHRSFIYVYRHRACTAVAADHPVVLRCGSGHPHA